MKKIIIATDFSQSSHYTIKYVLNHIQDIDEQCCIILLNTYVVKESDPKNVIKANDRLKIISKAGLEFEKNETLKLISNPKITVETASHMGTLSNVILQYVKNDFIDMVALGRDEGKQIDIISSILKEKNTLLLVTELPQNEAAI